MGIVFKNFISLKWLWFLHLYVSIIMCEYIQHKIEVNSEKACSLRESEHWYLVVNVFFYICCSLLSVGERTFCFLLAVRERSKYEGLRKTGFLPTFWLSRNRSMLHSIFVIIGDYKVLMKLRGGLGGIYWYFSKLCFLLWFQALQLL